MTDSHRCLHEADLGMKVTKLRAERQLERELQKHAEKCMRKNVVLCKPFSRHPYLIIFRLLGMLIGYLHETMPFVVGMVTVAMECLFLMQLPWLVLVE